MSYDLIRSMAIDFDDPAPTSVAVAHLRSDGARAIEFRGVSSTLARHLDRFVIYSDGYGNDFGFGEPVPFSIEEAVSDSSWEVVGSKDPIGVSFGGSDHGLHMIYLGAALAAMSDSIGEFTREAPNFEGRDRIFERMRDMVGLMDKVAAGLHKMVMRRLSRYSADEFILDPGAVSATFALRGYFERIAVREDGVPEGQQSVRPSGDVGCSVVHRNASGALALEYRQTETVETFSKQLMFYTGGYGFSTRLKDASDLPFSSNEAKNLVLSGGATFTPVEIKKGVAAALGHASPPEQLFYLGIAIAGMAEAAQLNGLHGKPYGPGGTAWDIERDFDAQIVEADKVVRELHGMLMDSMAVVARQMPPLAGSNDDGLIPSGGGNHAALTM